MSALMPIHRALRRITRNRLLRDQRGAYMIELAFVLPIFLMTVMGAFDLAVQAYIRGSLTGAVERAGRNSGLESTTPTAVDTKLREEMASVARFVTLTTQRTNFDSFSDVGQPEAFTDSNGNGRRDAGECFDDVNGNRAWDADRAASGQGGAEDIVLYQVTATYDRIFPFWSFVGQPQRIALNARTVLRNQPFAQQTTTRTTICT